jgi:ABC-type glycerol-3-phosphate transport system substrate-binding protein
MLKVRVERFFRVFSVFVLLSFVAGCNKGNDTAASPESRSGIEDKFKDRVTLNAYAFVGSAELDGRRTDPVSKYLEEKFNINLELTSINEGDYPIQFSSMIAANDLPDIFIFPLDYVKHFQSLTESNSLLAFDPYLKEYTPYTNNDVNAQVMIEAYHGSAFSPDGKQYIWGMGKGSFDDGTEPILGHYILWDVYKKAGYPKLENFDNDLLDVLEKMVNVEPQSISGQKTYGLGGWFGDGQGWGEWVLNYILYWQEAAYYVETSSHSLAISTIDSMPINVNQLKDPNGIYWRAMRFYNKANQRGLLDPDSFTQKSDMYEQKLKDGRYMFNVPGWMANGANLEFNKMPENTKTFVSLPALNHKAEYRFGNFYRGERMYGINANTKYPERCVALLDYMSSYEFTRMAYNGVEGMNWTMENGIPVPKAEYLETDRDDALSLRTGAHVYHHFQGYGNGTIDPANGIAVDIYQFSPQAIKRKMNDMVRDFCSYYGKETQLEVYTSQTPITQGVYMLSFGAVPENLQNDINGLNAYLGKNFAKVIAAGNDAEFIRLRDEMIAGMLDYHVDDIFNYFYNEAIKQGEQVSKLTSLMGSQANE